MAKKEKGTPIRVHQHFFWTNLQISLGLILEIVHIWHQEYDGEEKRGMKLIDSGVLIIWIRK